MIRLNGILEYSMGGFLCLRGFTSFKMLSDISEPNSQIQRELIEKHKGEMAKFLNNGEYRFFPEVILSLSLTDGKNDFDMLNEFHSQLQAGKIQLQSKKVWNIKIGNIDFRVSQKSFKNLSGSLNPFSEERINICNMTFDEKKNIITRIDGNHRMSAADEVTTDFNVPYCLLLFRNPQENEHFSRAIFHNINAKQIPLNLEENLKVILESDEVFTDEKLKKPSFGWEYYLSRKTLETIDFTYFPHISAYIYNQKYTFFVKLYKYLIDNGQLPKSDNSIEIVKKQLYEIENALRESEIIATTTNIAVIGALAYYKLSNQTKYRKFLSWIKKNNIGKVENIHIDDVINLYNEIYEHIPKKVFLARWYPRDTDPEYKKSEFRLKAIKEVVEDELNLSLTDLGTRDTGTFDIREVMYRDIRECDIFIADLSGARHNVMIEVGYALKHIDTGRMIFYFQETGQGTEKIKDVPFDVNHLSYDKITDSSEIKTKTKARIQKILNQSNIGEI